MGCVAVLASFNALVLILEFMICDFALSSYDLRFPEMYQKLTWEMGAQILAVPSAFTKVTGQAHWEILLRARAIECQAYVVAAAQVWLCVLMCAGWDQS